MNEQIKEQNDYCGATALHEQGYTGKGIVILNAEQYTEHGIKTRRRVLSAAPNATVINGSIGCTIKEGKVTECYIKSAEDGDMTDTEDFIMENNVKIITCSLSDMFSRYDRPKGEYWERLKYKYGLILLNSAGNDGRKDRDYTKNVALMIGAVRFDGKGGVVREGYSTTAYGIDFADFAGAESGTSFAAPYLAGKIALLLQKYGDKTQEQMVELLKSCCMDLDEPGEDRFTGWGLPLIQNIKEEHMKLTKFDDVKEGAWYEKAVAFCVEKGYMKGISDTEFAPDKPLTRAQMAQVLMNIYGESK